MLRKGFHSITVPAICNHKDKHRVLMVETYFFISNSVCTSHRIAIHLNSFIALIILFNRVTQVSGFA